MKVILYGTNLCPFCRQANELFEKNGVKADYREITEDLALFKEFLKLRDNSDKYADIKANGKVGVPTFVFEDGTITFDENEALAELQR
jgi:Glutaredoxin-related protein